jgi:hypothetical protein
MWYKDVNGNLRTRRGTSAVESYHSKYHHSSPASHYSPELFEKRRSSFNHNWNVRAGITNAGEKNWHTPDTRELEMLQGICLANKWELIPGLVPVKRLTADERRKLELSKLPLAAAVALGADIPSTSTTPAPAVASVVRDDEDAEAAYGEAHSQIYDQPLKLLNVTIHALCQCQQCLCIDA